MRASRWLMVALFAVSAVVVVEAQQPGRPGGGFGGVNVYTSVLSNKDLQAELKITDEQKEKLKPIAEKASEAGKKNREVFKDAGMDKEKLKAAGEEFAKLNAASTAETKKALEEVLTSDQKKRLAQIDVQAKGMRAFADEKIVKELNITESQTSKIKGILEEYVNDTKDIPRFERDKDKQAENTKKREKLRKAAFADIEDSLTADQKAKWKELTGEPFDMNKLNTFGGQRPGGNKGKTKD
jgi:Spy/CpxP family protein refolding chaperone